MQYPLSQSLSHHDVVMHAHSGNYGIHLDELMVCVFLATAALAQPLEVVFLGLSGWGEVWMRLVWW